MKQVLFIHGWYHSKERYQKIAEHLENCSCELIDLPGFGDRNFSGNLTEIEGIHSNFIEKTLQKKNFDWIIAHSWGGRVLLNALSKSQTLSDAKIILLNPAYSRNKNLAVLSNMKPLIQATLTFQKKAPLFLVKYPIKIASLVSVNHWKCIDQLIIDDVRRADPKVASEILHLMSKTSFRIEKKNWNNHLHLIYSDKDRAISSSCFQDLQEDLSPKKHIFHGVGHTLVLEAFEDLQKELNSIIAEESS